MTAPSQRETIAAIQVQMAGFGKDIEYLRKQADSTDKKLDLAIETMSHLAYTPLKEHQELEARVKALEDDKAKNSLGIKFSNDLAKNIWNAFILALAGALIWLATTYFKKGG